MYYNRNRLERIRDIQNLYLQHAERGATNRWIYQHVIYPRYRISRATFYNYLAINAKKKLKETARDGGDPYLYGQDFSHRGNGG